MRPLSSIRAFLTSVFRRLQIEREMEEELRSHLSSRADDLERQGLTRAEAERQARIEFGGYERYKEECREALGSGLLGELIADVRFGLRQLRRNPGFTLVAVLTLALGIGGNTAIFSMIDAFLLRQLPVENPQQLVIVDRVTPKGGLADDFPYPAFEQLRDRNHSFSGMFAWDGSTMSVTVNGQPEFIAGDFVSGSYFDVLGVHALLGRTFTDDDD